MGEETGWVDKPAAAPPALSCAQYGQFSASTNVTSNIDMYLPSRTLIKTFHLSARSPRLCGFSAVHSRRDSYLMDHFVAWLRTFVQAMPTLFWGCSFINKDEKNWIEFFCWVCLQFVRRPKRFIHEETRRTGLQVPITNAEVLRSD